MKFKRFLRMLALSLLVAGTANAADTPAQTGTRLDTRSARPVSLQVNETSVIAEVQRLIDTGETAAAVELARDYLERFVRTQHVSFKENLPARYFALNALCVALTSNGEPEAAAAACSEAIDILPGRWSAINNRGTARYVAARYGEAIADYRLALRVAPPERGVVETIEHNIALAIQRQQEARSPGLAR